MKKQNLVSWMKSLGFVDYSSKEPMYREKSEKEKVENHV